MLLLKTLFKLGLWNVTYMIWYRFSMKTGIRKVWFPTALLPADQNFFLPTTQRKDYPEQWKIQVLQDADKIINGYLRYYSYHWKEMGTPPKWFLNPFNGQSYPNVHLHWIKLPDFHPTLGDIKNVWEASRLDWVVTLARAYAATADVKYLNTLNSWLKDWSKKNPLNTGPNWKCGQEASIRVFNLLNAAFMLQQQDKPTSALISLIEAHLKRIQPNIRYARAQDNNHGTSEAAGLFIGGSWLAKINAKTKAKATANLGRHWLENRVNKLISDSGSFSQHSVTYHRVVLDTLCFAEFWRNELKSKPFSANFYKKAKSATHWLYRLTEITTGNAPNLGANDGARLLNTSSCNYRDFRPSLQLAAHLFFKSTWFDKGPFNESLYWFNLDISKPKQTHVKENLSAHGYTTLNNDNAWALIKWPYYKFRPSHNDALHLDIWHNGKNILCDAGSYSYNPGKEFQNNLKSVHFHNTVSFDDQEQMAKLSRFLLGNWLKSDHSKIIEKNGTILDNWVSGYTDAKGNYHQRKIEYFQHTWIVTDLLAGNFKKATIGFNLNEREITLKNRCVSAQNFEITIPKETNPVIKNVFVSDYYWEKHTIKRLILEVTKPGEYKTLIKLKINK